MSVSPAPVKNEKFSVIFNGAMQCAHQINVKQLALIALNLRTRGVCAQACLPGTSDALKQQAMVNGATLLAGMSGDLRLDDSKLKTSGGICSCFSSPPMSINGSVHLTMEDDEEYIISAVGNRNEGLDLACLASGLKAANYQLSGQEGEGHSARWGPVPPGIRRRSTFDARDIANLS